MADKFNELMTALNKQIMAQEILNSTTDAVKSAKLRRYLEQNTQDIQLILDEMKGEDVKKEIRYTYQESDYTEREFL